MTRITVAAAIVLLAACGSEPPPEADDPKAESASREHFLSEHQKAVDRARKLQDELNASVEKRLEEVDKQTRDDRND